MKDRIELNPLSCFVPLKDGRMPDVDNRFNAELSSRQQGQGLVVTPLAEPSTPFDISKVGGGRPFGGGTSSKSIRLYRKKLGRNL